MRRGERFRLPSDERLDPLPISGRRGREHDEPEVRLLVDRERRVLEGQRAHGPMLDALHAPAMGAHLVVAPKAGELGARAAEFLDQRDGGVASDVVIQGS